MPAPKERFVFAAGRIWDEAKNLAALQRVAPHLAWPVLVAGSDVAPGGVGRRAGESLCSLGWVNEPELAWWMSRAAIYASPARYAPFGMAILEAALSGCALVLGDLPSLREIWRDAAVYVPADDPRALHAALVHLVRDTARREALGALARRRAVRFSPRAMARRYLDVYAVALAARPPAPRRVGSPPAPTPPGAPCE